MAQALLRRESRGWLHYALLASIQGLKPPEHFLPWSHFALMWHCPGKRFLLSSFYSSSFSLLLLLLFSS
ncbi:unnamed protein product, partial [Vitis vinifera]|uniref:Uncharacterized protein n=1 Tax=Vitis vinifera TaxID=29760 RepID=D7SNH4_VITVI